MSDGDLTPKCIEVHDRQRMLPATAQQALVSGIVERLQGYTPCLDAGAGSGMITIPMARAGIDMVALDQSPAMLDALRSRMGPDDRIPTIHGDMRTLPFRDGSFGSAIVANVFHLIPDWQRAVLELRRVLGKRRRLMVNLGGAGTLPPDLSRVTARFWDLLANERTESERSGGLRDAAEFDRFMADQEFDALPPLEIDYDEQVTAAMIIERLEHNVFARPDTGNPESIRRAAEETRAWAQETLGALDRAYARTQCIVYRCFA